jgi:hypothetical protein
MHAYCMPQDASRMQAYGICIVLQHLNVIQDSMHDQIPNMHAG